MWRWLTVIMLAIVMALLIAVFFRLLLPVHMTVIGIQEGVGAQSAYEHSQDGVVADRPWGSRSDIVMMCFTGALLLVSFWQGFLWIRANKTGDDALIEVREANKASFIAARAAESAAVDAKRSVDAYIDAERGDLRYEAAEVEEAPKRFLWAFVNRGVGPVFIHQCLFKFSNDPHGWDKNVHYVAQMGTLTIPEGEHYSTGHFGAFKQTHEHVLMNLGGEIWGKYFQGEPFVFIRISVHYTTRISGYHYQLTTELMYVHTSTGKPMVIPMGGGSLTTTHTPGATKTQA